LEKLPRLGNTSQRAGRYVLGSFDRAPSACFECRGSLDV